MTVGVTDGCQGLGTRKTCKAIVSGNTQYCTYSTKGNGSNFCSNCSNCIAIAICPYVFTSITWDDTILYNGVTYKLIGVSGGSGSTSSTATYQSVLKWVWKKPDGTQQSGSKVRYKAVGSSSAVELTWANKN